MDSKIRNKFSPIHIVYLFLIVLTVAVIATACTGNGGSSVEIEITSNVENNVTKDVVITNNGDADAYVRIAVVVNWFDPDENIVSSDNMSLLTASDFGDDWAKHEDFFYYKKPVAPGTTVPNSFEFDANDLAKPDGADHLEITLLAQSVSSDEVDSSSGKKAVVVAWGVDPESLS